MKRNERKWKIFRPAPPSPHPSLLLTLRVVLDKGQSEISWKGVKPNFSFVCM